MIDDPEDEAFNEIERQAKQRKEAVRATTQTWRESASDYERGVIDGMQKQMQSSVDKAVNRMAQTQEPKIGCVNLDCDKCKAQTQEPVAWVKEDVCDGQYIDGRPRKIWWECNKGVGTAFYTTPPQRTWVGLTDDEKNDCLVSADPCEALAEPEARQLIEDVEQALKVKNT